LAQALTTNEFKMEAGWLMCLRHHQTFVPPRFIPQGKFYAVPEPQFVVDGPEIVFD